MPKLSSSAKVDRARRVAAGLAKRFSPRKTYRLDGRLFTRAQIIAVLEAHLEALRQVDAARGAIARALVNERNAEREAVALMRALKHFVSATVGKSAVALGEFGWEVPKKPGPKTVASKLQGVQRRRANER